MYTWYLYTLRVHTVSTVHIKAQRTEHHGLLASTSDIAPYDRFIYNPTRRQRAKQCESYTKRSPSSGMNKVYRVYRRQH